MCITLTRAKKSLYNEVKQTFQQCSSRQWKVLTNVWKAFSVYIQEVDFTDLMA